VLVREPERAVPALDDATDQLRPLQVGMVGFGWMVTPAETGAWGEHPIPWVA